MERRNRNRGTSWRLNGGEEDDQEDEQRAQEG